MSNYLFDSIRVKKPKRNRFTLKNIHRFSAEYGKIYPARVVEALPGDVFRFDLTALVRMAPMTNPVMSHNDVDMRIFFVPSRILSEGFEDFITGGVNGLSTSQIPYFQLNKGTNYYGGASPVGIGTLADYMGLKFPNTAMVENEKINLLPFKGYCKIWNDWFRDELLDNEIDIHPEIQGSDIYYSNYLGLLSRRFRKDYFTSARPTAQLGNPVGMPIEVDGTIVSNGHFTLMPSSETDDQGGGYDAARLNYDSENEKYFLAGENWSMKEGAEEEIPSSDYAGGLDITSASAMLDIAQLRRYFKIQSWNEKSMRGGNRYPESLLVHWGIKSSDSRLQRSEYIGGCSSPIMVSDIDNNSDAGTRPFGSIAGKGISVTTPKRMKYRCEEHGFIFVLFSIMPKVGYMQGVDRMFLRMDKFDYAWPEFAHIGEQEIFNSELYNDGNMETFGYQSRYAEYKSATDMVSGEFRSSLNSWIQNRDFANRPQLSDEFIDVYETKSELNQIFAVPSASAHFYCEVMNNIKVVRSLSKWSEPSLI